MSLVTLFRSTRNQKQRFTVLLRPYVEIMYRMAYRWTGSQHDAEDLMQDVLLKLADKVDEMEAIEQLQPWLIKVVYRRFVDVYRREQRSPIASVSELSSQSEDEGDTLLDVSAELCDFERLMQQQELERALMLLEPAARDTVLLHDVEGYTAEEVAQILAIEVGTVKSRVHRARQKLKEILTEGTFQSAAACQQERRGNL